MTRKRAVRIRREWNRQRRAIRWFCSRVMRGCLGSGPYAPALREFRIKHQLWGRGSHR